MTARDLNDERVKALLSKKPTVAIYQGSDHVIFIPPHLTEFYRRQGCLVREATEDDIRVALALDKANAMEAQP
jgi:hypothetical protein